MLLKCVTGGWSSSRMGKTDWCTHFYSNKRCRFCFCLFACQFCFIYVCSLSCVFSFINQFTCLPVLSFACLFCFICLFACLPVSYFSQRFWHEDVCSLLKNRHRSGFAPSPSTTPDSCREGGNKRRKAVISLGFSLGLSWQQEQCVFGEKCSPCVIVLTSPPPLTVFMKNNFIFLFFFCCRFDDSNLRW